MVEATSTRGRGRRERPSPNAAFMDHFLGDFLDFFEELQREAHALGLLRGARSHTLLPIVVGAFEVHPGRPYGTPEAHHHDYRGAAPPPVAAAPRTLTLTKKKYTVTVQ